MYDTLKNPPYVLQEKYVSTRGAEEFSKATEALNSIKAKTSEEQWDFLSKNPLLIKEVKIKKAAVVKAAKGKLSYKLVKVTKPKFKKYFKINKKNGKTTSMQSLRLWRLCSFAGLFCKTSRSQNGNSTSNSKKKRKTKKLNTQNASEQTGAFFISFQHILFVYKSQKGEKPKRRQNMNTKYIFDWRWFDEQDLLLANQSIREDIIAAFVPFIRDGERYILVLHHECPSQEEKCFNLMVYTSNEKLDQIELLFSDKTIKEETNLDTFHSRVMLAVKERMETKEEAK